MTESTGSYSIMTAHQHPEIDVGRILQQLRDDIRSQRLATSASESSAIERELRQALDDIELYRVVSAHWPLKSHNLVDKIVVTLNKLVRRLLRWYINPIVEQQNAYNNTIAHAVRLLAESYTELKEQDSGGEGQGVGKHMEQRGSGSAGQSMPPGTQAGPELLHGTTAQAQPPASILPDNQRDAVPNIQDLQMLVAERARHEPPAQFLELQLAALQPQLALQQHVQAHWPLEGQTLVQRIAAFVHKLMRQYLRWLVNPIVEQQNHANVAMTNVIDLLVQVDEQRRAELARKCAKR